MGHSNEVRLSEPRCLINWFAASELPVETDAKRQDLYREFFGLLDEMIGGLQTSSEHACLAGDDSLAGQIDDARDIISGLKSYLRILTPNELP